MLKLAYAKILFLRPQHEGLKSINERTLQKAFQMNKGKHL